MSHVRTFLERSGTTYLLLLGLTVYQCVVMAAQAAVQFSDTTFELLVNEEEINLLHNLSILTDEKYTAPDRVDGAYREAKEAAQMVLSMLNQEARDKHRRTENITQSLIVVGCACF